MQGTLTGIVIVINYVSIGWIKNHHLRVAFKPVDKSHFVGDLDTADVILWIFMTEGRSYMSLLFFARATFHFEVDAKWAI